MAKERLYLFDTTLRDGAQTNGVDFTLADKLAIAGLLALTGHTAKATTRLAINMSPEPVTNVIASFSEFR